MYSLAPQYELILSNYYMTPLDKIFRQRWLYHVAFWFVLVVPFAILMGGKAGFSYLQSFLSVASEALVYAVIVYINILILIPRYLQKRRYGAYFLLLAISIMFT